MTVITISRELGALGTPIAEAVAGRLGAVCVDKEVLAEMARQAGVPLQVIAEAEERLMSRPMVVSEEMRSLFAGRQPKQGGALTEAQYVEQMSAAIRALAERDNIVFVGRGAQLILADHPRALHVQIYAPLEARAARIQQRRNLPDLETATRIVQQADEQRRAWFRRFFANANWKDIRHYHLMINTARISAEAAVKIIVQAGQSLPDEG